MIYTVNATHAPLPPHGQLESESTVWDLIVDGTFTKSEAFAFARGAIEGLGYMRARVFRGKNFGRLIFEIGDGQD